MEEKDGPEKCMNEIHKMVPPLKVSQFVKNNRTFFLLACPGPDVCRQQNHGMQYPGENRSVHLGRIPQRNRGIGVHDAPGGPFDITPPPVRSAETHGANQKPGHPPDEEKRPDASAP